MLAATLAAGSNSGQCKVCINHACSFSPSKLTDQSIFLGPVNIETLDLKRSPIEATVGKPLETSDNVRDRGELTFVG